ncbi:MAG: hypothetical protein BWX88_05104 [Planctomycetes bacterium ADurb.Bin126]|nr:MAG: hypothetical protein BWX88_05104 [Planctomycetes bacterium ADurb.Bin126]
MGGSPRRLRDSLDGAGGIDGVDVMGGRDQIQRPVVQRAIGVVRIGVVVDFGEIVEAVLVAVFQARIRIRRLFLAVAQAVIVAVPVGVIDVALGARVRNLPGRVSPGQEFVQVAQAVAVVVGVLVGGCRVPEVLDLPPVGNAVIVGISFGHRQVGRIGDDGAVAKGGGMGPAGKPVLAMNEVFNGRPAIVKAEIGGQAVFGAGEGLLISAADLGLGAAEMPEADFKNGAREAGAGGGAADAGMDRAGGEEARGGQQRRAAGDRRGGGVVAIDGELDLIRKCGELGEAGGDMGPGGAIHRDDGCRAGDSRLRGAGLVVEGQLEASVRQQGQLVVVLAGFDLAFDQDAMAIGGWLDPGFQSEGVERIILHGRHFQVLAGGAVELQFTRFEGIEAVSGVAAGGIFGGVGDAVVVGVGEGVINQIRPQLLGQKIDERIRAQVLGAVGDLVGVGVFRVRIGPGEVLIPVGQAVLIPVRILQIIVVQEVAVFDDEAVGVAVGAIVGVGVDGVVPESDHEIGVLLAFADEEHVVFRRVLGAAPEAVVGLGGPALRPVGVAGGSERGAVDPDEVALGIGVGQADPGAPASLQQIVGDQVVFALAGDDGELAAKRLGLAVGVCPGPAGGVREVADLVVVAVILGIDAESLGRGVHFRPPVRDGVGPFVVDRGPFRRQPSRCAAGGRVFQGIGFGRAAWEGPGEVFHRVAAIVKAVVGQQAGGLDVTGQAHLLAADFGYGAGIAPDADFVQQAAGLLSRAAAVAADNELTKGVRIGQGRAGRQRRRDDGQAIDDDADRSGGAVQDGGQVMPPGQAGVAQVVLRIHRRQNRLGGGGVIIHRLGIGIAGGADAHAEDAVATDHVIDQEAAVRIAAGVLVPGFEAQGLAAADAAGVRHLQAVRGVGGEQGQVERLGAGVAGDAVARVAQIEMVGCRWGVPVGDFGRVGGAVVIGVGQQRIDAPVLGLGQRQTAGHRHRELGRVVGVDGVEAHHEFIVVVDAVVVGVGPPGGAVDGGAAGFVGGGGIEAGEVLIFPEIGDRVAVDVSAQIGEGRIAVLVAGEGDDGGRGGQGECGQFGASAAGSRELSGERPGGVFGEGALVVKAIVRGQLVPIGGDGGQEHSAFFADGVGIAAADIVFQVGLAGLPEADFVQAEAQDVGIAGGGPEDEGAVGRFRVAGAGGFDGRAVFKALDLDDEGDIGGVLVEAGGAGGFEDGGGMDPLPGQGQRQVVVAGFADAAVDRAITEDERAVVKPEPEVVRDRHAGLERGFAQQSAGQGRGGVELIPQFDGKGPGGVKTAGGKAVHLGESACGGQVEGAVEQRRIRVVRIGAGGDFRAVEDAVVVAVFEVGMGAVKLFLAIAEAVAVGVGVGVVGSRHGLLLERVGPGQEFIAVIEAVAIGIGIPVGGGRVAEVLDFPPVGDAIVVGIGVIDGQHGRFFHRRPALELGGVEPAGQPILAAGEVFDSGAVVIEPEEADQAGFKAGQFRLDIGADLGQGASLVPEADFVDGAVKAGAGGRGADAGVHRTQGPAQGHGQNRSFAAGGFGRDVGAIDHKQHMIFERVFGSGRSGRIHAAQGDRDVRPGRAVPGDGLGNVGSRFLERAGQIVIRQFQLAGRGQGQLVVEFSGLDLAFDQNAFAGDGGFDPGFEGEAGEGVVEDGGQFEVLAVGIQEQFTVDAAAAAVGRVGQGVVFVQIADGIVIGIGQGAVDRVGAELLGDEVRQRVSAEGFRAVEDVVAVAVGPGRGIGGQIFIPVVKAVVVGVAGIGQGRGAVEVGPPGGDGAGQFIPDRGASGGDSGASQGIQGGVGAREGQTAEGVERKILDGIAAVVKAVIEQQRGRVGDLGLAQVVFGVFDAAGNIPDPDFVQRAGDGAVAKGQGGGGVIRFVDVKGIVDEFLPGRESRLGLHKPVDIDGQSAVGMISNHGQVMPGIVRDAARHGGDQVAAGLLAGPRLRYAVDQFQGQDRAGRAGIPQQSAGGSGAVLVPGFQRHRIVVQEPMAGERDGQRRPERQRFRGAGAAEAVARIAQQGVVGIAFIPLGDFNYIIGSVVIRVFFQRIHPPVLRLGQSE